MLSQQLMEKQLFPLNPCSHFPTLLLGYSPRQGTGVPCISWAVTPTSGSVCFISFVIVLYLFNFPAGQWEKAALHQEHVAAVSGTFLLWLLQLSGDFVEDKCSGVAFVNWSFSVALKKKIGVLYMYRNTHK